MAYADIEALPADEKVTLARSLDLHTPWTLWVKANETPWNLTDIHRVGSIANVAEMWGMLHHIPSTWCGVTNLFLMREDTLPLHEKNAIFSRGKAGVWSIVVRRRPWTECLRIATMAVAGEAAFGDAIHGLCVVPVSAQHTICKVWATQKQQSDAAALLGIFEGLTNVQPRFKLFTE